jgi:predicted anti-sigma-YlaC factor YlaD
MKLSSVRCKRIRFAFPLFSVLVVLLAGSCSLNKLAMNKVAGMLTSSTGGTVFTGDNDPELVGDALPFAIKMYESLMISMPWHSGLKLRTGSLYIMYANAFLEMPAKMLSDEEYEQEEFLLKRSKNLYLRGRDILLEALELKYPGFMTRLNDRRYKEAAAMVRLEDIDFLYWGGAGWLGAFAIDPFDMDIGLTLPGADALMERVLKLDEFYGGSSIHEFYVTYYASLPDYMGGNMDKAREHFEKAIELSGGKSTSAYLAFATGICIKEQNVKEFKDLLEKVLELDPEADPQNRLLNILNQRKARWLLQHIEDFFLETEDGQGDPPCMGKAQ